MKQNPLLLGPLTVLLGCASVSTNVNESVAEVAIEGTSIIYRGPISPESNDLLFELLEAAESIPETLVITSKGGETIAGIELGRWVFRNRIDVVVPEYCLSSCANYVFPAGDTKTLEATAALAWHGGATQENWGDTCSDLAKSGLKQHLKCADIEKAFDESLKEFIAAEKLFFAEIGVDQRITVIGQDPRYDCRGRGKSLGWYYSIEDLERLGVEDIRVRAGKWTPMSPAPDLTICRVELGEDFS